MDLVLLVAAVCTAPTANINMLSRGSAFIADHLPKVVDVYIVQIEGICINENPFKITTEFICGGL